MAAGLSVVEDDFLESHILGTLYGNCIGDAIGLLSEFMSKPEAKAYYGKKAEGRGLEYNMKVMDMHRQRWATADWTDDSDQMILILDSILDKHGEVNAADYAEKLLHWIHNGFPELGDTGGLGIGATTYKVVRQGRFTTDPHAAAEGVWERSGRFVAPNGGVMRTSILGVYQYEDIEQVTRNTLEICKVTHADPRCHASCVAVTSAIAFMLQRDPRVYKKGHYDVAAIRQAAFDEAKKCFDGVEHGDVYIEDLHNHMFATKLKELKLDEVDKIGYTYKTMGAGFWALAQSDFRKALTEIVLEAGDADTNGAVAGAMLGCKLGHRALPESWLYQLHHKDWLDQRLRRFMTFAFPKLKLKILPDVTQAELLGHLESHILGTVYGQCIGDAIGLLTEFMTKAEAKQHYDRKNEQGEVELTYDQKVIDRHRQAFEYADWTDDTDQMILIMDSILARHGEVNPVEYGMRLKNWARHGFPELGDNVGCGLGTTTHYVLKHEQFDKDPHQAARDIWERSGCDVAPNGAVMRTSILGVYKYKNTHEVRKNTLRICRVTHADPRCEASCIAVTSAISYMLHRTAIHYKNGAYDVDKIIEDAYMQAVNVFSSKGDDKHIKALRSHMYAKKLSDLKLSERDKIGYTLKTLGAGFWALRQQNFKKAITDIVMEAGDADTNAAVAGALLGCKLGYEHLATESNPDWLFQLKHKDWLDQKLWKFLTMAFPEMSFSILPNINNLECVNEPSNLESNSSETNSQNASKQEVNKQPLTDQSTSRQEMPGVHSSKAPESMDVSEGQVAEKKEAKRRTGEKSSSNANE